jgi:hypothetical protein
VGFFVPVYNIYWLFGAHMGFVKNYNRVAAVLRDRLGRSPAPLRMWPFAVYPIVLLAWLITLSAAPVAAAFINLAVVAFRAVLVVRACDAVNALHALRRDSPDVSTA